MLSTSDLERNSLTAGWCEDYLQAGLPLPPPQLQGQRPPRLRLHLQRGEQQREGAEGGGDALLQERDREQEGPGGGRLDRALQRGQCEGSDGAPGAPRPPPSPTVWPPDRGRPVTSPGVEPGTPGVLETRCGSHCWGPACWTVQGSPALMLRPEIFISHHRLSVWPGLCAGLDCRVKVPPVR